MDARPEDLAQNVRAKRAAIDNDLELLRVRLRKADPRHIEPRRWANVAVPLVAGAGVLWWAKRRRAIGSLEQLLIHELKDLYAIEQELLPSLGRMRSRASNPELQHAFEQHTHETDAHVGRLERVFRSVGTKARRGTADAVTAIVLESERLVKRNGDADVRDAWLIATAQRIEHLEIAMYGTARTFAETLGYTYASQLLQQTLEEERATDRKLTLLAERFVNPQTIRSGSGLDQV